MWDYLKINLRRGVVCLVAILMTATPVQAAHDEEEFLSLPAAEADAKAKDYDEYFRIVHWPSRLPSTIIKIYLSHRTATLPERGFIEVAIRFPGPGIEDHGKFFTRSRALTEKEVQTIRQLFESEEIFSLPFEQRSYGSLPQYGSKNGPGHYFFVHVDKPHHRTEEIIRAVLASQPAQRVVAGIVVIANDFLSQIEKESGWTDLREGKEKE